MIVGKPNTSRAGNFSSSAASIVNMHCSPPCDSSMPPAVCFKELLHWQTLRKSIQEVGRANLAAPLDCPLSKTIQFPLDLFQNLTSISLLGDFTFFLLLFYICLTEHTQFPLHPTQIWYFCYMRISVFFLPQYHWHAVLILFPQLRQFPGTRIPGTNNFSAGLPICSQQKL